MVNKELIQAFAKDFQGELVLPENPKYDSSRQLWNGFFDKFPAAIAFCSSTSDVVTAVNFVRKHKFIFSVRGGGHDYAGNSVCEDGLVIDLSRMNKIEIDEKGKTACVEGGATVGELDSASQAFGLALPTGTVSTIGIGGLTLGGGSGYLSRRFGMTLDNLLSVEIVTADGNVLTANESENEDLFWAVRGGGGNFGIVTSFKFLLHEVGPEVLSFQAYFPHEKSAEVLRFYREFMKNASDELQCYGFFLNAPPLEPFPREFHGKAVFALIACYSGNIEKGKMEIKALEELSEPFLKFIQP
ncbi:MAG TPA: FAD-binding oxidoreductase, partial [Salinimicrobium sp.]|nr:FAD-binding oxidoreductase [Salinimicrobium sp.]